MSFDIDVERQADGLVWITINRAQKHNALAGVVLTALAQVFRQVGSEVSTRLIILRGAGDQYFAAGGDLVELAAVRTNEQVNEMADRATAVLDTIRECPLPVIAYVNGDALGGGSELAVACDMRLMVAHARIGFVQGRLGISSAWGGGPDLCAMIGPSRAMRMMSRCEMVPAFTAVAWGLADLELTAGREIDEIKDFVQPMLNRSRLVLQGIKAQTRAWREGQSRAERRQVERGQILATWASAEHWSAVERFLGKEK